MPENVLRMSCPQMLVHTQNITKTEVVVAAAAVATLMAHNTEN